MKYWIPLALLACLMLGCSEGNISPARTTPEEQKQFKEDEAKVAAEERHRPDLSDSARQQNVDDEERRQRNRR